MYLSQAKHVQPDGRDLVKKPRIDRETFLATALPRPARQSIITSRIDDVLGHIQLPMLFKIRMEMPKPSWLFAKTLWGRFRCTRCARRRSRTPLRLLLP